MLNPNRPEIEQIVFPDEYSVLTMFRNMEDSRLAIEAAKESNDENKEEIIARNKEYISSCLAYETIRTYNLELAKYEEVLK